MKKICQDTTKHSFQLRRAPLIVNNLEKNKKGRQWAISFNSGQTFPGGYTFQISKC